MNEYEKAATAIMTSSATPAVKQQALAELADKHYANQRRREAILQAIEQSSPEVPNMFDTHDFFD